MVEELTPEEQEILEKADFLENLKSHPGWKILEEILNIELHKYQRKILECGNWEDYVDKREKIKAIEKVLGLIDRMIEESGYIREKKRSNA